MLLTCMSCNHMFDGKVLRDELGFHAVCPVCGASFPVELKNGRAIHKPDKTFYLTAKIHFRVSSRDIDDIMASALEGGITGWCCRAEVVGEYLGEYASDQISRGGSLILYDAETDDKWELTLDKFLNGLKMYIEEGGTECVKAEEIDTTEIDAAAADSIIQYGIFGELTFC